MSRISGSVSYTLLNTHTVRGVHFSSNTSDKITFVQQKPSPITSKSDLASSIPALERYRAGIDKVKKHLPVLLGTSTILAGLSLLNPIFLTAIPVVASVGLLLEFALGYIRAK